DFRRSGELHVATADWQYRDLVSAHATEAARGLDVHLLDRDAVRAQVDSPTYLGAVWDKSGCALVDPARLAWGLRSACLALGVRIYENSPVSRISSFSGGLELHTWRGRLRAGKVALATGAHGTLLKRLR